MVFFSNTRRDHNALASLSRASVLPNVYDLLAIACVVGLAGLAVHGVAEMRAPLDGLASSPMTLSLARLPTYALRQLCACLRLSLPR